MSESEDTVVESPRIPCDIELKLEELFKLRYTEEDADYTREFNIPLPPPPCILNWTSRPKRTFDYSRGGGRGGRGGRYGGHQRSYHDQDRRREHNRDGHNYHGNQGGHRGGYHDNHHKGHYSNQGGRDNHGHGRGQAHYAGMRNPDGSHHRQSRHNQNPY